MPFSFQAWCNVSALILSHSMLHISGMTSLLCGPEILRLTCITDDPYENFATRSRAPSQYKDCLSRVSIIKIRRLWDRLNMGIPILVRLGDIMSTAMRLISQSHIPIQRYIILYIISGYAVHLARSKWCPVERSGKKNFPSDPCETP